MAGLWTGWTVVTCSKQTSELARLSMKKNEKKMMNVRMHMMTMTTMKRRKTTRTN
jgi:hypothetical protein